MFSGALLPYFSSPRTWWHKSLTKLSRVLNPKTRLEFFKSVSTTSSENSTSHPTDFSPDVTTQIFLMNFWQKWTSIATSWRQQIARRNSKDKKAICPLFGISPAAILACPRDVCKPMLVSSPQTLGFPRVRIITSRKECFSLDSVDLCFPIRLRGSRLSPN